MKQWKWKPKDMRNGIVIAPYRLKEKKKEKKKEEKRGKRAWLMNSLFVEISDAST